MKYPSFLKTVRLSRQIILDFLPVVYISQYHDNTSVFQLLKKNVDGHADLDFKTHKVLIMIEKFDSNTQHPPHQQTWYRRGCSWWSFLMLFLHISVQYLYFHSVCNRSVLEKVCKAYRNGLEPISRTGNGKFGGVRILYHIWKDSVCISEGKNLGWVQYLRTKIQRPADFKLPLKCWRWIERSGLWWYTLNLTLWINCLPLHKAEQRTNSLNIALKNNDIEDYGFMRI